MIWTLEKARVAVLSRGWASWKAAWLREVTERARRTGPAEARAAQARREENAWTMAADVVNDVVRR